VRGFVRGFREFEKESRSPSEAVARNDDETIRAIGCIEARKSTTP
jgi:hypothetical protein